MALPKIIRRELDVAFSKQSQPVWLRIVKYVVLGSLIYLLRGSPLLWITLLLLFAAALSLHFWYRHKTEGWTKSYGGWKYFASERTEERLKEK